MRFQDLFIRVVVAGHTAEGGILERNVIEDDDDLVFHLAGHLGPLVRERDHDVVLGLVRAVGHHRPVDQDGRRGLAGVFTVLLIDVDVNVLGKRAGVGAYLLRNELHQVALLSGGEFRGGLYIYDGHRKSLLQKACPFPLPKTVCSWHNTFSAA